MALEAGVHPQLSWIIHRLGNRAKCLRNRNPKRKRGELECAALAYASGYDRALNNPGYSTAGHTFDDLSVAHIVLGIAFTATASSP